MLRCAATCCPLLYKTSVRVLCTNSNNSNNNNINNSNACERSLFFSCLLSAHTHAHMHIHSQKVHSQCTQPNQVTHAVYILRNEICTQTHSLPKPSSESGVKAGATIQKRETNGNTQTASVAWQIG